VGALAQELAGWAAAFTLDEAPESVRAIAVNCVVDSLGVAVAGSMTPWAQSAVRAALMESAGVGPAHVLGSGLRAGSGAAALANGTSGHALDFDDDNAQVHVGAAVVPTAFAVAEALDVDGRDLLRAVIIGYEVASRVGRAMDPVALYARGFHPTGIGATFGAAATAAALMQLDEEAMTWTLGIAGSMAAGLLEFYTDGSMTKRLHAGHPAASGVTAARLAANGFTGPATVLEGEYGALSAYSDAPRPEEVLLALGDEYRILDTAQKKYPMNFSTHGAIEGVAAIMRAEALDPSDVERVEVRIRPFVAGAVGSEAARRPRTALALQMSMPFAVALAASRGTVTLDHITEETLVDEELLALAARVDTVPDASLEQIEGIEDGSLLPTRLTLTTRSGATHSFELLHQPGTPQNPLSKQDLHRKFLDCVSRAVGPDRARAALDELGRLPDGGDIAAIMVALEVH